MSKLRRLQIVQEGAELPSPPSCRACAHSYFNLVWPEKNLLCYLLDNVPIRLIQEQPGPHCPNLVFFKRHPLREPDGSSDIKEGLIARYPYGVGFDLDAPIS
jgi:hypothetical protein